MIHSPIPERLCLALALLAWAVLIGGGLYAHFFALPVRAPIAIMSPQAFAGLAAVSLGFLIAALACLASLLVWLLSAQPTGALLLAGILSGLYALPCAALLGYWSLVK
ncbi:MAG: hypothetical protein IPO35_08490 [Uliginosibacterium sp.]|jgi:hypothetical protein|nr:hypothetical protein [Uliginosibacterium sp.]